MLPLICVRRGVRRESCAKGRDTSRSCHLSCLQALRGCLTLCLSRSVSPLTDGPHSTTVCLTLPCFLSAVKCNVITPLYNQNSNYSTGASLTIAKRSVFEQMCRSVLISFHCHCCRSSPCFGEYCSIY